VQEAEAYAEYVRETSGEEEAAKLPPYRALPMQALDHAAGYLLAFGIAAALCKTVTVSSLPPLRSSANCMHWVGRKVARGAYTSHSALRFFGSDCSGICTRSLRLERVVPSRLDACRLTRKWRLFLRRLNGIRGTLGAVDWTRRWRWRDRGCRSFGMRPVSRDLGSGRGRRRCGLMRTSQNGCRDLEGDEGE